MSHLLLISSDRDLKTTISRSLKKQGFRLTTVDRIDALSAAVAIHRPDVVLLDFAEEVVSEICEICRRFRDWNATPVIVSSGTSDTQAKIETLNAGADDFMTKPLDLGELVARIKAIQRRLVPHQSSPSPIYKVGQLTLNFNNRTVHVGDELVHLSHKEYELLRALVLGNGQTLTYRMLLQSMGGKQHVDERAAVRLIVYRLRSKLGDYTGQHAYILTESGIGYRLNTMVGN